MNDTQEIEMIMNVVAASTITSSPTTSPIIATPSLPGAISGVTGGGSNAISDRYNGITLQAIGLTLVGGLCIWTLTVIAFGIAVMLQHTNVAPRCTARHSNTIWRSKRDILAEVSNSSTTTTTTNRDDLGKKKRGRRNKHTKDGASSAAQNNIISDVEHGIPTTTTTMPSPQDPPIEMSTYISKQQQQSSTTTSTTTTASHSSYYSHPQDRGNPFLGWIPWTLHLSYDRMLRGIPGTGTRNKGMDGQLLGVNLDAIVLFRYNALCLRVTAMVCFICIVIILPLNLTAQEGTVGNVALTNYGQTTIANIFNNNNITDPALLRLYVIAFCTWYITYFALRNIERDWKENLVLRRVYYLESDHYGSRQIELTKTLYCPLNDHEEEEEGGGDEDYGGGDHAGGTSQQQSMKNKKWEDVDPPKKNTTKEKKKNKKHRNPWIPNPEQRDTVPSIELYSVLVGGLPSLPDEVLNSKVDMQAALGISNRVNIDWQLAVATTFFDHCVPNQPGFSSSVVAVTILPGAPELAKAWRKWYAAAAALRRLRFIRSVIRDKRYYSIDDLEEEEVSSRSGGGGERQFDDEEEEYYAYGNGTSGQDDAQSPRRIAFADDCNGNGYVNNSQSPTTPGRETADIDYHIFRSLNYGPEQQAVYSREMAQGAAACCPNGCCEGRVRRQPIDKLLQMEEETVQRLENAQYELKCAQMKAAVSTVDGGDKINGTKSTHNDGDDDHMQETAQSLDGLESMSVEVGLQQINGFSNQDEFDLNAGLATPTSSGHQGNPYPNSSRGGSPSSTRNSVLRMNAEGRFFFNNSQSTIKEDAELLPLSELDNSRASPPSSQPVLRQRTNTIQSLLSSDGDVSKASNQWDQVNSILRKNTEYDDHHGGSPRNVQEIETGIWVKPTIKAFMTGVKYHILSTLKAVGKWTKGKTDKATSTLARDSTYAVVTFSSRQAAVAARHCLADGRGVQKWLSLETLPVAPLADAAPCDIITCRGCCRPVTLNLNQNQLMIRRYIALSSLAFIYVFYTIPITLAQSLVSPQKLQETVPAFYDWINSTEWLSADIMSGLVSALLYTLFFALCPVLFKGIANSGSRATSVQEAERYALKYYWYFMLVTAFAFTGLADAAINIWNHTNVENSINSVEILLESIARQTPLTTAATWLNWIIVRTTMTLPLQYLLQVNTFLFGCIGWKCCARCVMGGGPGGPIPYRVYIDGGTVFLCVVALAPQSPLVAPVACLYYLFCAPLWRRNCIFMYRPKFDTGGERWPFLSDILITSVFVGQFLLTLQMALKDAVGPAIVAALPAVPTYLYRQYLLKTFKRAYDDAGLLQTSLLDGWDNTIPTTIESREEFRRFLVDAHKAAYIPVCIAGGATNILTSEHATAVPSDNDDMLGYGDVSKTEASASPYHSNNGIMNVSSQRDACITPSSTRAERSFQLGGVTAEQIDDAGCTQS